jgi:cob(I)alamin adenosyltransferase
MSGIRIYTTLGDDGSTGLLFGGRTSKADPLVETLGGIDEAVAALGLARAHCTERALAAEILQVQRDLFVAAADLAANPHARDRLVAETSLVTAAMTARVEDRIDALVAERPLRPVFVVPGANPASAALDLARTAVRRAERRLVGYRAGPAASRPVNPRVMAYLNRVSDLLFVLARRAAGPDEEPLSHGEGRAGPDTTEHERS